MIKNWRQGLLAVLAGVLLLVSGALGQGLESPGASGVSTPLEANPETGDTLEEFTPGAVSGPAPEAKPGSPYRIKKIVLRGCRQISCRVVRSIMRQKATPWWQWKPKEGYDQFWALDDQRRIELFYRSRGFYSAQVDLPRKKPEVIVDEKAHSVTIIYTIVENRPVLVAKIEIIFEDGTVGENDQEDLRGLLGFKVGDRFESEPYQDAARAMESYFKDRGYYRAEVKREAEVDPAAETALVTYRVTHRDRYWINSISVEGCVQTDPSVVMRALTIKAREKRTEAATPAATPAAPGQKRERGWYSRREVIENQRRIQRLPIYRTVRIIENVDDVNHKIDLVIKVDENKPREVKTGIGYGSEEGVRVQASWRHVNFFGGARELMISARWSELLEREGITFLQPNLERSGNFFQMAATHSVEHEEAYTHEVYSLAPTYHFTLPRFKYVWTEFSYRVEDNHTSRITDLPKVKEEELAREGILSALVGRVEWMQVDDPIRPQRGGRASFYLEYGGGPLGGDFPYVKVIGEVRGYYPLYDPTRPLGIAVPGRSAAPGAGSPVIGALRLRLGWAEPLDGLERLPIFLRFFSGGAGSVRGFDRYGLGPLDPDEKPLGGVRLWEGSFEVRFSLSRSWGGVVFVDSGWVWPEGQDYDPNDVMYTAGFGFRYDTPIGPLALDFGFPLNPAPNMPTFKIHFNVGNTF